MLVIVDYGMGNVGSILNMLKKVGVPAKISSSADEIDQATQLILPGVGSFDNGMRNLGQSGLIPVLNRKVLEQGTPVLGICLGMQLMTRRSEEGTAEGLGWVEADTIRFKFDASSPDTADLKVPHMGWNEVEVKNANGIMASLEGSRFYFVHSYHVICDKPENVVAIANYGHPVTAVMNKANITGAQFHPEKSHKFGIQLFRNFAGKAQ